MSREKQIEEMAKCCTYYHNGECCACTTEISDCDLMCEMFGFMANLEQAGYRKQSEGEWVEQTYGELKCSACGIVQEDYPHRYTYCPNCGAKMKGGE